MYRGKRLRRRHEETVKHEDTNKPVEEVKESNNNIHDDPDAFIYKENEDYGYKKVDNKKTVDKNIDDKKVDNKKVDKVDYETKVKTTIDDSVNVHKKKMTIDKPLTKEDIDKLNKKELEDSPSREIVPTSILDKTLLGNTLENDAMMVTTIQSGDNTFNLYDFFQGYESTFSEYITKLYRSGKIKYKNITIDFSYKGSNNLDNYINTTLYDRAQYTFTEEDTENGVEKVEKGMLVAGDILTYTIDTTNGKDSTGSDVSGNVRFNVAFYITEVKVVDSNEQETVTSKVKTGILDEPPETILSENGTDIISTAKDTNGNVYAIRKAKKLEDVSAFLQTETITPSGGTPYDTLRVLEPTNKSKFSYYNNQYQPNYGATLKDNHLFFSNKFGYDSLTAPHPDMTGSVILPDSFPSNPITANTEIQPFDCYVKGYFVVYRVGILSTKSAPIQETGYTMDTDYISQTYSFEMNEWSHLVCGKTTDATPKMIIQTDWFTSNITDKQLYLKPFNSNISAPFCGSDGWFRTNCTNSLNPPVNNVFGIASGDSIGTDVISTTDKTGFCILSPKYFVGPQNYKLIEEVLCDDSDQSIFDENDDEIVKSQKVSRSIQEKKSSGCCIV